MTTTSGAARAMAAKRSDSRDDLLLAGVRVFLGAVRHLAIGRQLRQARDHRARGPEGRGHAPRLGDERLATCSKGSSPDVPMACRTSSATAEYGTSDRHRGAFDVEQSRVGWEVGQERRDERRLADAHLADDRPRHELPRALAAVHRAAKRSL